MGLKKRLDPRFKRNGDGTMVNCVKVIPKSKEFFDNFKLEKQVETCRHCDAEIKRGGVSVWSKAEGKSIWYCNDEHRKADGN